MELGNGMDSLETGTPRLDRGRQAAPQVFECLRERIISLVLVPGTVLSRAELMAEFGVSVTPIRDALLRLAEEGLVDIYPQHATVVSRIDLPAAAQAHYLRRSIELEVARDLALSGRKDYLLKVQATLAQQRATQEVGDFEAFVELDHAFHRQLYEAAGVPDLWTLVRRRSGHIDRLRRLHLPIAGKTEAILRDHAAIVAAIAAGDAAEAQARVREHLSGTLAKVDEIRARFPDHFRG